MFPRLPAWLPLLCLVPGLASAWLTVDIPGQGLIEARPMESHNGHPFWGFQGHDNIFQKFLVLIFLYQPFQFMNMLLER